MMILARHGNTFDAKDTPVWVGARTDLLLTAEGLAQAERVATWLEKKDWWPARVIAGPLKRTQQSAQVVGNRFGRAVETDDRLKELDYGPWEGLTADQIKQGFGADMLEAWEKRGQWPTVWPESQAAVEKRLAAVLADYHGEALRHPLFLCTSNGILRLIRRLITGESGSAATKVPTGGVCILRPLDKGYDIVEWAIKP